MALLTLTPETNEARAILAVSALHDQCDHDRELELAMDTMTFVRTRYEGITVADAIVCCAHLLAGCLMDVDPDMRPGILSAIHHIAKHDMDMMELDAPLPETLEDILKELGINSGDLSDEDLD